MRPRMKTTPESAVPYTVKPKQNANLLRRNRHIRPRTRMYDRKLIIRLPRRREVPHGRAGTDEGDGFPLVRGEDVGLSGGEW